MDKTLVVWIIGGNSVGKTTQARMIHRYLQKLRARYIKEEVFDVDNFCYTHMSDFSCNLGDILKSQCSGTDVLSTKKQIEDCFNYVKNKYPVVVVEGIMATGQWINFLKQEDTIVFTLFLNMTPEVNFSLVSKRRAERKGIDTTEVEISQKTKENMAAKLRGFSLLFERMKQQSDYVLKLNVDGLTIQQVFKPIKCKLDSIFKNT